MDEDAFRDTKIYTMIAVSIIALLLLLYIISNIGFNYSYVPDEYLDENWGEDIEKRERGSQLFGLNKWNGFTYIIDNNYKAYLSVITIKSFLILSKDDLKEKTLESIHELEINGISIDINSLICGERSLKNNHKTSYFIYNGNDTLKNPTERIKIIGEAWNCVKSGTSIICIGVSEITDNELNNANLNFKNWEKIIKDKDGTFGDSFIGTDGLIYNILCD